jgi:peptide/nickel transport system substrate-binding protein
MIRKLTLIIIFFITLGLISCTKKPETNVLKLRVGGEPSLINPILSTDSASSTVESFVFNGLLKVNADLEFEPDLAESYEISSDNKTYTFKLKKNVLWHDGVEFTAKDVKFTFEKILDEKTNTVRRSNLIISGKPIKFKIIDDYTIQIILPEPFAPFLSKISTGILPEHILKNKDINKASFNRKPIGTGPFIFKKWKSGQFVYLQRNEKYFGTKPKLAGIIIKNIADTNTALIALKKGEIHLLSIPGKDFPYFKRNKNIKLFHYQDLLYTYMGFNLEHPFFKDKKVRQAIAHAINKRVIVNNVLKNYGIKAPMPSSPVLWSHPKDAKEIYEYNPEKSKKLLKESGFKPSAAKILYKDNQLFQFTLVTNKGNKDREKTAEIIQQSLLRVGIQMNIQLKEWSAFVKDLNSPTHPKPFDAVLLAWSLSLDPDAYSIWHSSQYPKGFNLGGYSNPEVDKLIEKGRVEMDRNKRASIYHELFPKIAEDLPYVFLYYPETLVGVRQNVKGLAKPGPAGLLNPIENIYLEDQ